MAAGSDARVGIAAESTYGTRVAPSRFLPLTAEDLGFAHNRAYSNPISTGIWGRPSRVVGGVGSGSISGDVMTVGMSFLINGLHGGTVTPAQLGGTPAYGHTHTLSSPPSKSYSIQVQTPPVSSSTLIPHDMLGVMFGGITISWAAGGLVSFEIPTVYQALDLGQSNATFVAPAAYDLFDFQGATLTIGGVAQTDIIGDGSLTISYPLRDDAYALGSSGKIRKPVLTDKPTATIETSADFEDNTHINRTVNNSVNDVVLKFEGDTISGSYKETFQVTLPDCVSTTNRATVSTAGPLEQGLSLEMASSTGDAPTIYIISTETTI
jgi:hypothetical protein